MVEQRYTTKTRAKRIALQYFKRLHPFRRWKLILSVAAPLVAAAWLIAYAARGDQRIYTSGPLSTAHAMFGTRCSACHGPGPGATASETTAPAFFLGVSERACLACHDGPIHHESQAFDPSCATCHVEHKGRVVLAALADGHCIQCHAALRTKTPTPSVFAAKIRDFASSHPEFAVAVREQNAVRRVPLDRKAELRDVAQIKLNHQKHLKIGLKGLEELRTSKGPYGILVTRAGLQLSCTFCHQSDASRAYMQPISYPKHCAVACHPLDADARLPDAVAPHDTPAIVHAYLRTLFLEAFEQCQALRQPGQAGSPGGDRMKKQCQELELVGAGSPAPPRGGSGPGENAGDAGAEGARGGRFGRRAELEPERASPRAASPSAREWTSAQLQGAEAVMFKQKCEFCHTMTFAAGRLPQVVPTMIPVRWLPHSVFDHGAHRPLACTECHKATTSQATSDVLLPSVTVCRECHRQGGGARAGCVECHLYHDKARERDPNGPFAVPQVVKGPQPAGSPPK